MNKFTFSFAGETLRALPSGALHWPAQDMLVVSDLHLGKSARLSSAGGSPLPPYENRETLGRLEEDLERTGAWQVICLGDSFDSPLIEAALPEDEVEWLLRLQAGRRWTWIEGNHDPGPVALGGAHRVQVSIGPLTLRHIATDKGRGEVSGHYHPKARLSIRGRTVTRPCFLWDDHRLILPAFGAYTGGLRSDSAALSDLMARDSRAILTGPNPAAIPMPR